MSTPQYTSNAHRLRAHELTRRAERRGDGLRASYQGRATDNRHHEDLSPLQRLQRQANATLADYHAISGTHAVGYDEDGNEIEDGEANFGFVETEREEGDE